MKKRTILLFALLACALPACAEAGVYAGEVVATEAVEVLAPCDGTIERYEIRAGETIAAGDVVATYATEKVYATGDGTVAAVWADVGEEVESTLVEVEPIGKYTVYATTDGAYKSEDTYVVHAGETVYIKCTADGTHRGTGIITSVDGETYMVTTTGGAFYVGETVYLYRDADFTYAQRIGIGTLIYTDNVQYAADGTVLRLYVAPGDRVERGQILYETLKTESTDVTVPVSGIVFSVGEAQEGTEDETQTTAQSQADDAENETLRTAQNGAQEGTATQSAEEAASGISAVSEGDVLAVVYPRDGIMVEIAVPEESIGAIEKGQTVNVMFADDPDTACAGTVARISNIAADGAYRALIAVAREDLSVGMTCDVRTE